MEKDWTGNSKTTFVTIGASNHVEEERAEWDFYATDPIATKALMNKIKFNGLIWEPACGQGHMVKPIVDAGYEVYESDIIYRGFGKEENFPLDFLKDPIPKEIKDRPFDIITNPPYAKAKEFIESAIEKLNSQKPASWWPKRKIAMFLKVTFLEGQKRYELFKKYPPKEIIVFPSRIKCARNGNFEGVGSSAVAYSWWIWEEGHEGKPTIDWFPPVLE